LELTENTIFLDSQVIYRHYSGEVKHFTLLPGKFILDNIHCHLMKKDSTGVNTVLNTGLNTGVKTPELTPNYVY